MSRKLPFEEILERRILTPGQSYLQEYLGRMYQRKDCQIGIYEHKVVTHTCKEKIDLLRKDTPLNWDLEQAIKAPYFKIAEKDRQLGEEDLLYCFVFPELEREVDKRKVSGMHLVMADRLLPYMEHGTCTPFVAVDDVLKGRVAHIYVHRAPKVKGSGKAGVTHLDHKLVDISVGGVGEDAHKISLWMPYGAMWKMLRWRFGQYTTAKPLAFKKTDAEIKSERIRFLLAEQQKFDDELKQLSPQEERRSYLLAQEERIKAELESLESKHSGNGHKPLIATPDEVKA